MKESGNWNLLRKTMTGLRERADTAVDQLSPSGVTLRDMIELVGYSLRIRDIDSFVYVLAAARDDG